MEDYETRIDNGEAITTATNIDLSLSDLSLGDISVRDLSQTDIKLEIFRNRSEMEARLMINNNGEDIVVDRIPVTWKARENTLDYLSVSKISAYEQCPACFNRLYLSEETTDIDDSSYYTKYGSIMHEVVEKAFKIYRDNGIIVDPIGLYNDTWKKYDLQGFEPYDEARDLVEKYFSLNPLDKRPDIPVLIEEEWRGTLGGVTFGMILDYAGVYKNNPKMGLLRDYKTNRMPFSTVDLQNSLQLRIYEIILRRHLMPEIEKWVTGYELFFHGWQQCPIRSEDDLKRAEDYVANIAYTIKNDNTWEERVNNYCQYRACRFTCKSYKNIISNPDSLTYSCIGIDDMSIEEIERQRSLMATIKKNAEGREKECSDIIKAKVEQSARTGKKIIIDGQELSLYANSTQSYKYEDVRNTLLVANKLNLLDGCVSINKTKFDKIVNADPNLKMQLTGCIATNYSTPYIVKRKV